MAGIGFQLTKLMRPRTFTGLFKAYGYAALIGSGPWVLSMITIAILGLLLHRFGGRGDLELFFVTVTHIFAASLVLTGPLQLILSRYAADCIFAKQDEKVFTSLMGGVVLTLVVNAILGYLFFTIFVPATPLFQIASTGVLMVVSAIWTASVYLTAMKDYLAVVRCFAVGYATSLVAAWALGLGLGVAGTMLGFLLGQIVLLLSMLSILYRAFGTTALPSFEFLGAFRKYIALAACGFTYNFGIWVDKALHWWLSPHSHQVAGALHASPLYDQAIFMSFLSIVPGMAVFLMTLETTFAWRYSEFFRLVTGKGTLNEILEMKNGMVDSLRNGVSMLLKFQGAVTLAFVLSAEHLLKALGLGAVQTLVFQLTLIGVFMLVLFLALLTVLFYLDRLRDALLCSAVFALTNLGLTFASLLFDERWYGLGFTAAACVSALLTGHLANRALHRLEYETFTAQPIYP